ncbi:hypothetical protein VB796_17400 [Arcicella sp. LKC2W]|uniref:hypothetical protein n=1 Tax=Arcicella sp. LKC2W TaxID=2984198 RepID=UPI002B1F2149|nr:hypothetical protein [Arcicella sp. LKC2W]MEA5460839.1 hypothetical protein [Arcicella sp. LKC2W]
MKNNIYIILLLCLWGTSQKTLACDLCGCGNGGSFWGIMPQSHKSFVGLRYGYRSYDSHVKSVNLQTQEQFWKTELWARVYPLKKVQVLAFIPYNFNKQTIVKTGKQLDIQGIGDMSLLINYNLINTLTDTLQHQFHHNLLVGSGFKLPSGKYKYDYLSDSEVANPNFQLGTGSTDFTLNVFYTMRFKKWGMNSDFSYKMNSQNANEYRFGNRINSNISVIRFVNINPNLMLIPNIGFAYENAAYDVDRGIQNTRTGGEALLGSFGLESYHKKISAGINYQSPITQNLANGELKTNSRLNVHFTIMI